MDSYKLDKEEMKVYDRVFDKCGHAAANIVGTFISCEVTIAKTLGMPRGSWEVQKHLRLPIWFVGSNLQSEKNLRRIAANVVAKTLE